MPTSRKIESFQSGNQRPSGSVSTPEPDGSLPIRLTGDEGPKTIPVRREHPSQKGLPHRTIPIHPEGLIGCRIRLPDHPLFVQEDDRNR